MAFRNIWKCIIKCKWGFLMPRKYAKILTGFRFLVVSQTLFFAIFTSIFWFRVYATFISTCGSMWAFRPIWQQCVTTINTTGFRFLVVLTWKMCEKHTLITPWWPIVNTRSRWPCILFLIDLTWLSYWHKIGFSSPWN